MNYTVKPYPRNIPDRVLIADLRKTAKRLGKKYISCVEYEREGKYSSATLYTRFGGWNATLSKAGLKVNKLYLIPDEELLKNMKNVWDTFGRQPLYEEMRRPLSMYDHTTYASHFGSWSKALSVFEKAFKKGKPKPAEDKKSISSNAECRKLHESFYEPTGSKNRGSTRQRRERAIIKIKRVTNKSLRFDVMKRDDFKCRACGASPATDPKVILHVDHIIPRSKGGKTTLENLQTLCKDCNLGKGTKTPHPCPSPHREGKSKNFYTIKAGSRCTPKITNK